MRLRSEYVRAVVLSLTFLGFVATAPLAAAGITNHSGTICKNEKPGDAIYIDYLVNATRSTRPSDYRETTDVACPLIRTIPSGATPTNGAWIYVDIYHAGTQTTLCTCYSYDYQGTYLAGVALSWTGSGFHEFVCNLTGVGKSTAWSDYSVVCTIPSNLNGRILLANPPPWVFQDLSKHFRGL